MNDHHENNEHRRQEDELLQQQQQQQQLQVEHLLSPEGQKVLSINGSRSNSEFPPFINGQIYQAVNSIANEFLSKVRTAVQDLLIINGTVAEAEREEREIGLTKTIVDEDWYDDERKIATVSYTHLTLPTN